MLTPGARLGALEVLGPLGAGGMGEVYRARDTRLGREVAVKILPDAVADDADRLARFEREARLLAALNHPGIAAIHGLEQYNGRPLLVLELVEGPTLADRLRRGALPMRESLEIGRQIAQALEAAHDKGIVHRDLKPSNIKLTSDGKVKLLDFGLAKAIAQVPDAEVSNVSTDTSPTDGGVLLGTAPYMSPEQARGQAVNRQTDVWAFGCVLYEMLTGRRAFPGATGSDAIAAILERDPDWRALPESTPPLVQSLLRRCLQKPKAQRLHDVADARIELQEALAAATPETSRPSWRVAGVQRVLPVLAAVVAGILVWAWMRPALPDVRPHRLNVYLPPSAPVARGLDTASIVALSPDGTQLVYSAEKHTGTEPLYARALDGLDVRAIPGTEGGYMPFFSPDGRWVGFAAERKLKKVPLGGGPATTLCDVRFIRGATWGQDGAMVFTPDPWAGLWHLAAGSTRPQILTTPDVGRGETSHRWPQILPGGRTILFTIHPNSGRQDDSAIAVLSLDTREHRVLLEGGSYGRYVPTGHLVYASGGALLAAPFDLALLRVTGSAEPVLDDVRQSQGGTGVAQFDFSRHGQLAYLSGFPRETPASLAWVDRKGTTQPATQTARAFSEAGLALSSEAGHLVVAIEGPTTSDLWRQDLGSEGRARLTFEKDNNFPVLSPDGERTVFSSNRAGAWNLFSMPVGGGAAERLTTSNWWQQPTGWSPDGRTLAFAQLTSATAWDMWTLSLDGDRRPRPLVVTPFIEGGAVFSPNGRWLAYATDESGRSEVYVRPYSGPDVRWQVSTEGGVNPVWAPNGRELFYLANGRMMAIPVSGGPEFRAGRPHVLFSGRFRQSGLWQPAAYAVTRDAQRFLMVREDEDPPPPQVVFVPSWFEELKARVPRHVR